MKQRILICIVFVSGFAVTARAQSALSVEELARPHLEVLERHYLAVHAKAAAAVRLDRQLIQTWEEPAWQNSSEVLYEYDNGRLIEVVTRDWDDNWENAQRTTYAYESGRLTSFQYDTWRSGAWQPEDRSILTYQDGELAVLVSQTWQNGGWVNTDRLTYTYVNGNLTGWSSETWTGSWTIDERVTAEEVGGDVIFTYEERVGGEWVNVSRTRYLNTTTKQLFDFFEDFMQSFDQAFAFWGGFRIPDYVEQEWDGTQWVNESRQTTEYDGAQKPTNITTDEWEDGEWVGSMRQVRSYGEAGRHVETLLQFREEDDWMTFLIESYTYYDNGAVHTVLQQYDFGGGPVNSTLVSLEWSDTPSTSVEREIPVRSFVLERIYPNPFNPAATIVYHLATTQPVVLRVFDVLGRQVATLADGVQAAGRYEIRFEASALPSGIYLVRLEGAGHMETRRVSLIR